MPLTAKGEEILAAMKKEYGAEGERVFYASRNAGTITGVDSDGAELGLRGKSITVLDTMAEQIASLGSEAKRLVERMDKVGDETVIKDYGIATGKYGDGRRVKVIKTEEYGGGVTYSWVVGTNYYSAGTDEAKAHKMAKSWLK